MKRDVRYAFAAFGLLGAIPGAAMAGGFQLGDRNNTIMFEKGTYAEATLAHVAPKVTATTGGVLDSGEAGLDDTFFTLGFKTDVTDKLSFSLFSDRTWGGSVEYGGTVGDPTKPFAGTYAGLDGYTYNAALRYRFDNNISIFGGPSLGQIKGAVGGPNLIMNDTFTGLTNFAMDIKTNWGLGWNAGVAYEIPEYGAYASLTYFSKITNDTPTRENIGPDTGLFGSFDYTKPEQLRFAFQMPLSAKFISFGSINWTDWRDVVVAPPGFVARMGQPMITFEKPSINATLGGIVPLNENWMALGMLTYEHGPGLQGDIYNVADGYKGVGLGLVYMKDNYRITGVAQYLDMGDRDYDAAATKFEGNSALSFALKVGYSF